MDASDTDLLRQFAHKGTPDAFAALVARYVDLVYSAARRQVRSPELAEEVTQSVFIRLAQHAGRIRPGTPLAAWLFLVTRRTALNAQKHEMRRLARETAAFEISAMNSPSSDWSQIEPLLDEAIEALSATDRSAVLLRYFENKNLRDVGLTLGTSEDAARKRVNRAIDQLRLHFSKRGIAVSASGLATGLSSNGILAAPAGLGASVSTITALSVAALPPAAVGTITTAFMTTSQKYLAATALAVALGAGLYEGRIILRQQDQIVEMKAAVASARGREQRLRTERDELLRGRQPQSASAEPAADKSASAEPAADRSASVAAAPSEPSAGAVQELRNWMARLPQLAIPEFAYMTEEEWAREAEKNPLRSERDARIALRGARSVAKQKFGILFTNALASYASAHGGRMPADVAELAPYFDPPVEPSILARYMMTPGGDHLATDRMEALVDDDYEVRIVFASPPEFYIREASKSGVVFRAAVQRFAEQNDGKPPAKPDDVVPYLSSPISAVRLDELFTDLSGPRGG